VNLFIRPLLPTVLVCCLASCSEPADLSYSDVFGGPDPRAPQARLHPDTILLHPGDTATVFIEVTGGNYLASLGRFYAQPQLPAWLTLTHVDNSHFCLGDTILVATEPTAPDDSVRLTLSAHYSPPGRGGERVDAHLFVRVTPPDSFDGPPALCQ